MAMVGCALASTFPLKLNPLETKTSSSNRNYSARELAFVTSHPSGIKISYLPSPTPLLASSPKFLPFRPLAQFVPSLERKQIRPTKYLFQTTKTKKLQFVNLLYKRIWWEAGKRYVKLPLSTKALKTIEKNGLDAVAKKAGIDLRKK